MSASAAEAPDHDVRAVLAIRPFRTLWLTLALSSFGDWLGLLATTAMAARFGGQTSYAAANLAVSGVLLLRLAPAVVFGPLAGAVADRWDRRTTMVVGDLLRAGLFVSVPLVHTLWWLFVATLLIEVVALFWTPAKDASVPNLVPARRLEVANQLSLAVTYGSAPVAALLFSAAAVATRFLPADGAHLGGRVALALYADAATYLVAALVVSRLRIPRTAPAASPGTDGGGAGAASAAVGGRLPSLARSVLDGWRFVVATPLVRGLVVGMMGAFAAGGFVIGVAPTFVEDLGGGEAGYGVLFGAVFTGLALGMWVGPRTLVALARWRLFALSLVAAGALLVATGLVGHLELVAVLTVGVGACGGVAWVTGYTLLGAEVADEVRGRTFAFVQSAARVVLIAVIAVAPALAAAFGHHRVRLGPVSAGAGGAALVLVVAGVVAAVIGLVAHRQLDDGSGGRVREELVRAWRLRRSALPEPSSRRRSGFFIAVEGGDGAGKSTQVRALEGWLTSLGHDVVTTREPGATAVGAQVRELLLHGAAGESLTARAEALLYAADRAQHVEQVVRPALERGAVVVTDRYTDSSVAYQGAGRALDGEEVAALSRWGTEDLVPDLTVVLDLTPAAARARLGGQLDRLEREPEAFHAAVRSRFLDLARRAPRRYAVVDADGDPEVVATRVREALLGRVPPSARQSAQAAGDRVRAEREAAREAAASAETARLQRAARVVARREAAEQATAERAAERARATSDRESRRADAVAEAEGRAAERARRDAARRAADRDRLTQELGVHPAVPLDDARDPGPAERTGATRAAAPPSPSGSAPAPGDAGEDDGW